jgi:uncharacterized protein DUF3618
MPTSEELARQARATREQLSRTADELRARLNGPALVDEMTGFLAQSGGSVIPERPVAKAGFVLPLALIGAGVAWLALEARRREQRVIQRRRLAAEAAAREAAERQAALAEAAASTGYGLNVVESASLAPATLESEKAEQRSLPL